VSNAPLHYHLFICHNQRVAGWWYSTKFPLVRIQWAKGDIQIQYGGGVKPKCLCGLVCLPSQQGTEFPLNNKKKKQGTELMMTSLTFSPTWAYIARRLTTVSVAEGILLEGIASKNMHGMESCQRNKKDIPSMQACVVSTGQENLACLPVLNRCYPLS